MMIYDGVPVKIVNRNERGDVELEVTEKMPWDASPDVGNCFWVNGNDEYLKGDTEQERIIQWLCSGETGLSSETMVCIHTGNEMNRDWGFRAPMDIADYRRCWLLVEAVPEIRNSFPLIAECCPAFKSVIENWDVISAAYERERGQGNCPETYRLLKESLK